MKEQKPMIEERTWEEFKNIKLLWFINTILHLFGWAIVFETDKETNTSRCYPARVRFRGFDEATNTEGYIKLSEYLKENIDSLVEESKE